MPMVPVSNVVPMQGNAPGGKAAPPVDPTYLAMAAATMHEQGRLFEKPQSPFIDVNELQDPTKGIQELGSKIAPNGIGWEKWRRSENVEDEREPLLEMNKPMKRMESK